MNIERNDKEPEQMRCAAYLRVASYSASASSLEDQKQHCRRFAEEHGWIVPDEYVYTDAGKSGTSTAGRDGLASLIIAAKEQPSPFRMVLVEEASRFARNCSDVFDIVNALALHGVHVYFINQDLDSRNEDFHMILMLTAVVEGEYIARLSDKVRRAQMGRVISGFTSGGRCFGYRSVPVDATPSDDAKGRLEVLGMRLEIVDAEAETVRRIYEMFARGVTITEIVKTLNAEHVADAKIGKPFSPWTRTRIRRILGQERYIGTVVWNRTKRVTNPRTGRMELHTNPPADVLRVSAPQLRIVTDELWGRVQARLHPSLAGSRSASRESWNSTPRQCCLRTSLGLPVPKTWNQNESTTKIHTA
ncbi:recombinase family protein [Tunturiibacter gelidoferens]|uniref:DNA invertase Pin-like site-specific DNA recombinase n=1 Tax=Tunturiibacter lichenicola TaxID=2051959 RepID=A0A7Y9NS01_9BACT|nr:recombinase family protein [Edaphobacter lichenicola]NYF53918.1 DNA invertase Pin-like site-specific DNA recombinase [Edaphobacter lichenicola]